MNSIIWIELALFALIIPPTFVALFGAPWVPTPIARVRKMMELGKIGPGKKVFDIGCGDGRMVYVAANEFGADATGVELSPFIWCMAHARKFLWRSKAKIRLANFQHLDLSRADAIVCYLLPETLVRMRQKLERELRPGSRIVSYAFHIEGWEPVHVEESVREKSHAKIFVYEMPVSKKANGADAKMERTHVTT